ncbi:hypothetical protein ACFXKG_16840 [Streptomyces sp. NPDC059255]|uniref:hypothetical protein n=1 Tax=Streptomyces sp. NPDC059255 TaxID=3346793 RepID=UPI0036BC9623
MEAIPDAGAPAYEAVEPTGAEIQQFWWLHDARWYQGVLNRFGQEAANEINAEAVRFVGRRVASWYSRSRPSKEEPSAAELAAQVADLLALMGSNGRSEVAQQVLDDDEWETVVGKSFPLLMLRAAGTLEGYECPCLELRAGWFEGLRVPVRDSCVECQRTTGSVCRFKARILRDGEDGGAVSEDAKARAD